MLRIPQCPERLETMKEVEKHINELPYMDVIRRIGHNEIVEITTPVLVTWNDGKSRLCGDFRALNSYTKADRYPIARTPHALVSARVYVEAVIRLFTTKTMTVTRENNLKIRAF
ncbi:hypothetical protein O181_113785 [Austropuccinia psidii MF-1]|uniref:Uncharacterized protein n=1 Tax=Austropuccinia psidii MF-1 TaxID=1389203 RepID=A0A9Q3PUV8_9BASI|nr:hypothetical protein [Austropuccinia psidii MF-1]